MLVLVSYDVDTTTAEGRKRLRQVAKTCVNFGQRVQNSVFECVVTPAQYAQLKIKLNSIINSEKDSLRIYHLGSNWQFKIESLGRQDTYDPEKDAFIY
jgi:CRISPR-associated protein Cas2